MHSVLMDIVKDDVDAKIAEAVRENTREVTREVTRENRARDIKALTRTSGYTVEQAMDALAIPADQREDYAALVASM